MDNSLLDFYPTPKELIRKMLEGVKLGQIQDILEPSAGKGDICDNIKGRTGRDYSRHTGPQIDVVEINPDLQHILKGKGYHLVQDDFLTFETHKVYDLIIANFPFILCEKNQSPNPFKISRDGNSHG